MCASPVLLFQKSLILIFRVPLYPFLNRPEFMNEIIYYELCIAMICIKFLEIWQCVAQPSRINNNNRERHSSKYRVFVFFSSQRIHITITRKVVIRFLIGLKQLKEISCYKMVETGF